MSLDVGSPEWNARVLSYDPFAGDMDLEPFRVLHDEIVVAKRKSAPCRECRGPITKGQTVRWIQRADREGFYGGRICQPCCECLAIEDDVESLQAMAQRSHDGRHRHMSEWDHDIDEEGAV